jgi:zinc/manganese transport system permease protein
MIDLLFWPFLATLVITVIHAYLGLHVVTRGVIFVDLAMAQMAALGTTVGFLLGLHTEDFMLYLMALLFTLLGAAIFAYLKSEQRKIPQEAIIGITYVVSAALMLLVLSKLAEGAEHIDQLLVGSILFVTPETVGKIFLPYLVIGIFHWVYRARFQELSQALAQGRPLARQLRFWDFIFYTTFGLVVTLSVKVAGVFLVFSFLIIPAVVALLFTRGLKANLLFAWLFSVVGSVLGLWGSVVFDIPTGATIVVTFGALLVLAAGIHALKSG